MKTRGSVVVAIDGESKCGKTKVAEDIAREAQFQHDVIPNMLRQTRGQQKSKYTNQLQTVHDVGRFHRITTISAGNVFRAATLHIARLKQQGINKTGFTPDDSPTVRRILSEPNIEDVLHNDEVIKEKVSTIGKFAGAQAMCGGVFCDWLWLDYAHGEGRNLVIVDARDPVGHMRRNARIGYSEGQVDPKSILPIYIETSPEVAAARMSGDYEANLAQVRARRHVDATRKELPVTKPTDLVTDYDKWRLGVDVTSRGANVMSPYCFENGANVDLNNIQYFAGCIATMANTLSLQLRQGQDHYTSDRNRF